MGNEALYIILGILLTVLQTLVLRNSALLRKQVQEIQNTLTPVVAQVGTNTGQISHLEQNAGHYMEANDLRVAKVTEKASDLKDDLSIVVSEVKSLKTQISLCPTCPQPGRRQEWKE